MQGWCGVWPDHGMFHVKIKYDGDDEKDDDDNADDDPC